jgi:hypothetical protein
LLVSPRDSALLVAFVAPLDVLCSVRQTRMPRSSGMCMPRRMRT